MIREKIIETIRAEKPYLQKAFGVEEIALFGSYARDEARPGSDIDILVKMNDKSLSGFIGIIDFLQGKLHHKIDLVTKHKYLSERFLKIANKDIIYV